MLAIEADHCKVSTNAQVEPESKRSSVMAQPAPSVTLALFHATVLGSPSVLPNRCHSSTAPRPRLRRLRPMVPSAATGAVPLPEVKESLNEAVAAMRDPSSTCCGGEGWLLGSAWVVKGSNGSQPGATRLVEFAACSIRVRFATALIISSWVHISASSSGSGGSGSDNWIAGAAASALCSSGRMFWDGVCFPDALLLECSPDCTPVADAAIPSLQSSLIVWWQASHQQRRRCDRVGRAVLSKPDDNSIFFARGGEESDRARGGGRSNHGLASGPTLATRGRSTVQPP